jgi:transcriptional regulator with XRE-family HTH domain
MPTISERIKQALDLRQMKQTDLVKKTGIGKSSISTYISGDYEPKQKNIYNIAKALNVSEAWLMGFDVPIDRIEIQSHNPNYESFTKYSNKFNDIQLNKSFSNLNMKNKQKVIHFSEKLLELQTMEMENSVNAAHERTDIELSPEGEEHDNDIMTDDTEWE